MTADKSKSKTELIEELRLLRQRIAELEPGDPTNRAVERAADRSEPADRADEGTRLKEAEEQLRWSEDRLHDLIDNALMGIYQVRSDGTILMANQRLAQILQYDDIDQFITSRPNIISCFADPTRRSHLARRLNDRGRLQVERIRWLTKTGRPVWVRLAARKGIGRDGLTVFEGVVEDVTQRVLAENALVESEERFRRLTESSPDMIYRMSLPDGRYEYVSPASILITGYRPEEFYASPKLIEKFIHPDWNGYFEEQWTNLVAGQAPPVYEYQIIHKSGRTRWLNQRNVVVRGERGGVIAIEGIVTDVTDRKETESRIKSNEERFLTFMKNLPAAAFIKDETGRYWFLNHAYGSMLGVGEDVLLGNTGREFWDQPIMGRIEATDEECVRAGQPVTYFEEIPVGSDGYRHLMITKFPIMDSSRATHIGGFAFDVTDQTKTQEALRKSEQLFRSLAESSPFIVYVAEKNGDIVYLNDRFEELTGYSREDARKLAEVRVLLFPDKAYRDRINAEIQEWEQNRFNELYQSERRIICRDGSERYTIFSSQGLPDGRILAAALDVTRMKKAEAELKQAFRLKEKAQAQHLALLRGTSSHVAHLVGGFLNKLVFALAILKSENTGPAAEFSMEAIERGSMQLAGFIKRFAAVGHEHKPNIESFSLAEKMEQVIDEYRERLDAGGIKSRITGRNPALVRSDPDLTAIVFQNTIANSLEAIEKQDRFGGLIDIDIHPTDDGLIRIAIRDSGVGLPKRDLDRAFEPFFSTKTEGYGLGLPITANIMKALGGEARLRSTDQDRGFVVELDFPAAEGSV